MSGRRGISGRLAPVVVCAVVVLQACGGVGEPPPASSSVDGPPESNLEMAARLQVIADRVDPAAYPYDNERRAELAYRQARAAAPGPARFRALLRTVLELIRSGAPEEALQRLREALQLLDDSGAPLTRDTSISLLRLQAAAGLRLGEQENCLKNHTVESCLLPISEAGVHTVERGSRNAIDALQKLPTTTTTATPTSWCCAVPGSSIKATTRTRCCATTASAASSTSPRRLAC
ncbi:MAG: hypothetical protein V3T72_09650 [Thermoanaerobaculia bacterium]